MHLHVYLFSFQDTDKNGKTDPVVEVPLQHVSKREVSAGLNSSSGNHIYSWMCDDSDSTYSTF